MVIYIQIVIILGTEKSQNYGVILNAGLAQILLQIPKFPQSRFSMQTLFLMLLHLSQQTTHSVLVAMVTEHVMMINYTIELKHPKMDARWAG